jgi:positive regulator of sigma E activity
VKESREQWAIMIESIPKSRNNAIMAALVYTISTLIILIIVRYILGTAISLEEFVIIAAILLVFNTVFQFYLCRNTHEREVHTRTMKID